MDDLNDLLPIIAHEAAGFACCGCLVAEVRGNDTELLCNECGSVLGVINTRILKALLLLIPEKHGG